MRIQTTLLVISLAGLSPLSAQNAANPEQNKAERALQEKLKELGDAKPGRESSPTERMPAPSSEMRNAKPAKGSTSIASSFSENAPESIPETEEQRRALEALKQAEAELNAKNPPRSQPPAKPAVKLPPPAEPAPPIVVRKPMKPMKPEPAQKPATFTVGDPVVIPADPAAQAKAMEALRQKTAELDAGGNKAAQTVVTIESPRPATVGVATTDNEAQKQAADALRQKRAELPAEPSRTRSVVTQPSTRTVVTAPATRTTVTHPSTRTVVVNSGTRAPSSSGGAVKVPMADVEAQAKAMRAVREKESELANGGVRMSERASTDAQNKSMEALRKTERDLASKNTGVWSAREAEAAANRRSAEDAAHRTRAGESTAFRTRPDAQRTGADADTEALRARLAAEAAAQTRTSQNVRTSVTPTPEVAVVTSSENSTAQAKAAEALRMREAELNRGNNPARQTTAEPNRNGVATPTRAIPNTRDRALRPGETLPDEPAPGSVPTTRDEKLAELLRRYRADLITPREYHQERAKIIAEP